MTPAMQQFHEIKAQYPDHIVLFRMGDFFETFYDDAKKSSAILGITLTARDRERKVPMAGIPFHALDNYLVKLVDENQKVVIVEQLEDPAEAKGVVKRGIVKIVTPGTSTIEKDAKKNNYLVALHRSEKTFTIAFTDLVEGVVYQADFADQKDFQNNILLLSPKEILVAQDSGYETYFTKEHFSKVLPWINSIDSSFFESIREVSRFTADFQKQLSSSHSPAVIALVNYLAETQKTDLSHVTKLVKISSSSHMNLDANAVRNLELVEGMRKGSISLFHLLDNCKTAAGSKKLKNWIVAPLLDKAKIEERLNSIQSLREAGQGSIDELQEHLLQIHDLYRISSKVGLSTANARDLRNAVESIRSIFRFSSALKSLSLSERIAFISSEIEDEIKKSQNILAEIDRIIRDDPPLSVREGGMIRTGIDEDLDKLHDLKTGGKDWLKNFEQEEIKKSGIPTLKVRFNKVFGYYIEVSKGQSGKVPDYFIRKQTLVNAERYITPELKEQEAAILGADDRVRKIEYEIFMDLLEKTKGIIAHLQRINDLVSEIDIYLSLAQTSLECSWSMPIISDSDTLKIENGRHPVIEHLLLKEGKSFVKNNVCLDSAKSLQIITGPNMGGKSTYIRQVALITLLAQIGSFVPAEQAEIGIVDRIFTRVGASDNLSQGESTFMVEMLEAAEILNNATSKSLIILDEIGRGTSTFDGMSIAWAICEYIQGLGSKTLFATHYHELTELSNKYTNVKNLAVKVIDYNGEIIFMHQIIEGKADKSYGIHVAKLAGLPDKVIKSSEKILKLLEKEKNKLQPKPQELFGEPEQTVQDEKSSEVGSPFMEELKTLNINTMSPIEALQKISDWQKQVK
jgi:DNA mismatch repair protein MutS